MLNVARHAPMTILANASSCVPATHMSTAGARLPAEDLIALRDDPRIIGLAEMMNFPGVVMAIPDVLSKVKAFAGWPIDGHAPGLSGQQLNAYVAAGIGSDHECVSVPEAKEKLGLGMYLLGNVPADPRGYHRPQSRRVAAGRDPVQRPPMLLLHR
jgi:adenine deaminase